MRCGTPRPAADRRSRPPTGVAVAEVLGEVEAQPLRQPADSATAPGARGSARPSARAGRARERSCRAAGAPSRRALRPGARPPSRPGAPPARAWACTLPVATHGTPSRSASSAEQAVAAAVVAGEGPLELHAEALRPEGPQQPARDRGRPGMVPRLDPAGHRTVAGAARQAHEPLGVAARSPRA